MKGIPIEPLAQRGKELTYYLTPLLCLENWDMYYPGSACRGMDLPPGRKLYIHTSSGFQMTDNNIFLAVYLLIYLSIYIYKVDRPKRHHASRKLVGGESIPALGFCDYATLGWDPASFRFQYCVHCSWVECMSFHAWGTVQNYAFLSPIVSWKNLSGESVDESSVVNFLILLCRIRQWYTERLCAK